MIKKLRIKFVVIIMALVGTVLVSVLGGYYVSAWVSQRNLISETLTREVDMKRRVYDMLGSVYEEFAPRRGFDDGLNNGGARIVAYVFATDDQGNVISGYDTPMTMDVEDLISIVKSAVNGKEESGWNGSLHIAWQRAQLDESTWCVVVTDTSVGDVILQNTLMQDIAITVAAMAILLAISIGLSTWVLKPVEQAWEQQRRFIADASHELKTPLAVIIANTQILDRDTSLPAESRRWVDSTADEAAHMKNLVEELLELARTDESSTGTQGVMQQVPVDFSDMVENASLEFDAIAFERGTVIEESIEKGVTVIGDPEWLSRLCKILIDNACKYSSKGEPVSVVLRHDSRKCTFSVNNHGNTIAPEDLAHVFDRFYRTDKARSRDAGTGGFGLGLAIAKGIATSHGGDIVATSTVDEGTTFTVTLPIAS